jgi:hypothetical protein
MKALLTRGFCLEGMRSSDRRLSLEGLLSYAEKGPELRTPHGIELLRRRRLKVKKRKQKTPRKKAA